MVEFARQTATKDGRQRRRPSERRLDGCFDRPDGYVHNLKTWLDLDDFREIISPAPHVDPALETRLGHRRNELADVHVHSARYRS